MVGRDFVAKQRQDARVLDVLDRLGCHFHPREIRRILHIGRTHIPFVGLARRRLYLAPMGVTVEDIGVARLEDFLGHVFVDNFGDFLL